MQPRSTPNFSTRASRFEADVVVAIRERKSVFAHHSSVRRRAIADARGGSDPAFEQASVDVVVEPADDRSIGDQRMVAELLDVSVQRPALVG